MSPELLPLIWFGILGILLAGYAILDGFDLGVGTLHLFVARTDRERRECLNAIGPLWDGNEVWLVTFGGALFAAFPVAYASVLSGFYTVVVLLLFGLILRAVSIEFRSKRPSGAWRALWDVAFAGSSTLVVFAFGLMVGNALHGLPLDEAGQVQASLAQQLNPYALAVAAFCVLLFALHACLFLLLRTGGALHARVRRAFLPLYLAFVLAFVALTAWTLVSVPAARANLERWPILWAVPLLNVAALFNLPRAVHHRRYGYAFFTSACLVAGLVVLFGVANYPRLLTAPGSEHSLTVFDAASSPDTLVRLLWIAGIGMPLVLSYTGLVYWTFRGRVRIDEHSY